MTTSLYIDLDLSLKETVGAKCKKFYVIERLHLKNNNLKVFLKSCFEKCHWLTFILFRLITLIYLKCLLDKNLKKNCLLTRLFIIKQQRNRLFDFCVCCSPPNRGIMWKVSPLLLKDDVPEK